MAKRKGFTGYDSSTTEDIQGANWGGRLRAFTIPGMVWDTHTGASGKSSEAAMDLDEQNSPARNRPAEKG